ncbi:MAG: LemA family protein [Alphaproteobacteria bacterium]|nr:LemA family protein [Alphaproteobacteria bacterium]
MSTALAIMGILLVGMYSWYVTLIKKRNKALEALSGVDVFLRQRFDLIPNILAIAQKYMQHEKSLLEEVTSLRAKADQNYDPKSRQQVSEHLQASDLLNARFSQLMLAVENYPDLKANQTMLEAMQTNNEVEGHIAAARRFYNASVTTLNNAVEIFPGNLIARMVGVTKMPFYETDALSKEPIKASQIFSS